MDDQALLIERIRALAVPQPDCSASLPEIEDTLTAGYAHAHALEAERWRIERRIGELAKLLSEDVELHSAELASLGGRMAEAEGELAHLRGLLAMLRDRAAAVRTAA